MTTPNLLSLSSIEVGTALLPLTTTETDVIVGVPTDHVFEVTAIFVTNIHDTVVPFVTVYLRRSGVSYPICNQTRIQTKSIPTNVLASGRTLYLQEGDSLRAKASAVSLAIVYVPYNDMLGCFGSPCP